MKTALIALLLFAYFVGLTQEIQKESANITIRGYVGIPRAVGSKMFSKAFRGVYETSLNINFKIVKNTFVGLGYFNNLFEANPTVFVKYQAPAKKGGGATIPYDTQMSNNGAYIKVGYDKFVTQEIYTTVSVNTGYMFSNYSRIIPDSSSANQPFVKSNFGAIFFQPELSAHFITEKILSFSLNIGHTTLFKKFDPKAPRFNQVQEVRDMRNNAPMNWLSISFGFAVLIN